MSILRLGDAMGGGNSPTGMGNDLTVAGSGPDAWTDAECDLAVTVSPRTERPKYAQYGPFRTAGAVQRSDFGRRARSATSSGPPKPGRTPEGGFSTGVGERLLFSN